MKTKEIYIWFYWIIVIMVLFLLLLTSCVPELLGVPGTDTPPVPYKTHTPGGSAPCYHWYEITQNMVGLTVCVTGTVVSVDDYGSGFEIRFYKKSDTFFLDSKYLFYTTVYGVKHALSPGDCVIAHETVRMSNMGPFMELNNLYFCNP
jgi:hypothetical protein